jgi:hypothetical protein
VVLGRLAREDEVLWSIRVEPAVRLDPVLILVGAPSGARLTAVAWARALLKDLHPERPAACVLVGDRPRLLAPAGPVPRCLPTDALLAGLGEGPGDLAAAVELVWAELGRCADQIGRAVPQEGARLCVIGGPWDAAGEAALAELDALGVQVLRIDADTSLDPPAAPPPDGATLTQLLGDLGVVPADVRGRLEVSLAEAPRRWWVWSHGQLIASPPEPPPQIDLPLRALTVVLASEQEPEGTVRIDLADGTPLVEALEPEVAGELDVDLVAALEGL